MCVWRDVSMPECKVLRHWSLSMDSHGRDAENSGRSGPFSRRLSALSNTASLCGFAPQPPCTSFLAPSAPPPAGLQATESVTGSAPVKMQSVTGSATVKMQSVAAKTARTGSIGSRSHVDMHVEENEEELGVVLPVPPQVAHTTTRKVAGLGPAMGATYAAGMLHRMALHGQTDGMK
jgi:hypothetical protein